MVIKNLIKCIQAELRILESCTIWLEYIMGKKFAKICQYYAIQNILPLNSMLQFLVWDKTDNEGNIKGKTKQEITSWCNRKTITVGKRAYKKVINLLNLVSA